MSKSTRYFQLIPNILVEYNYHSMQEINNQIGNAGDHIADLGDEGSIIISNGFCGTKAFKLDPNSGKNDFVLPVNKSESKFVLSNCTTGTSTVWTTNTDFSLDYKYGNVGNNDSQDDILKDTFRLHFTSRNFFGDYDGYIFTVYAYDKMKNKVSFLSQYMRRTDDPQINEEPLIINQKLYTSYKDFTIPNITALVNAEELGSGKQGELFLKNKLFKKYPIMDNSPLIMSVYGVKNTFTNNGFEYYNTEKINSVYIPIVDNSNKLDVTVSEAEDGDYFIVYPQIDGTTVSFSDYIYNISDGHPENYVVFYELKLKEYYLTTKKITNPNDELKYEITHREQYIINAAQDILGNDDTVFEMNEKELDSKMYYRPIIQHSGTIQSFDIIVNLNIINTFDNTTIVKRASLKYDNPKKYGKRMNRIYLGSIPAQVNVYNKKPDLDRDGVKITNASSNVKIENHQHSVTAFIECANVGVAIEQIPKEDIL